MVGAAHDAFKALGQAKWGTDFDPESEDGLREYLNQAFSDAHCLIDSIPVSVDAAKSSKAGGRPRSATDSRVQLPDRAARTSGWAQSLRKEWKEVKVNPRENPLGLSVYKLSGRDGKGAWFARRSAHEGLSFEKWKLAMEKEFAESMKIQGNPGSGNVRGIGAERRVEHRVVEGCGTVQVFQLSAQFPGPTTPRDFITMMLTTDTALEEPQPREQGHGRYFMVLSKPCVHPDCPQRSGFIRGHYESVEFIREIKVEKQLRKVRSSLDVTHNDSNVASNGAGSAEGDQEDGFDTMIEWLMVTRSDPGGNVPRFMVERGTPGGIASDADKFLRWASSKSIEDFEEISINDSQKKDDAKRVETMAQEEGKPIPARPTSNLIDEGQTRTVNASEPEPAPSGFYGMIAGALGAAASYLPGSLGGSAQGGDTEPEPSDFSESDTSSIASFHSVDAASGEDKGTDTKEPLLPGDEAKITRSDTGMLSTHSSESHAASNRSTGGGAGPSQAEKELRKLEERKRKMEEKMSRAEQQALVKRAEGSQREEAGLAKMRDRHSRELAKQEERYRRELARLEAKRLHEQRKQEDKRRKHEEREARRDLGRELERCRAERDVARSQVEVLKEQVGELQAQNTMLVARLGQLGLDVEDVSGAGGGGVGGNGGEVGGAGHRRGAASTSSAGAGIARGLQRSQTDAAALTGK